MTSNEVLFDSCRQLVVIMTRPMTETSYPPIHVIGGGLAGSEAAWQIAQAGIPVILHEMRGVRGTDAHKTDGLELLVLCIFLI